MAKSISAHIVEVVNPNSDNREENTLTTFNKLADIPSALATAAKALVRLKGPKILDGEERGDQSQSVHDTKTGKLYTVVVSELCIEDGEVTVSPIFDMTLVPESRNAYAALDILYHFPGTTQYELDTIKNFLKQAHQIQDSDEANAYKNLVEGPCPLDETIKVVAKILSLEVKEDPYGCIYAMGATVEDPGVYYDGDSERFRFGPIAAFLEGGHVH